MSYASDFLLNFRRINQFLALFYVPAWLKSNVGVDALANDLEFVQNMANYQTEDAIVASAVFNKLSSHTWYLTETTVAFSLFSNHSMTAKVKESMASRLLSTSSVDEFCRGIPQFRAKTGAPTQIRDLVY